MKQQWYVRREGQVYGPYTQNTLNVHSVLPTDELGQAPQGPWKTASSFPGFATRSNLSDTNSQLTQSSLQARKQTKSNPSPTPSTAATTPSVPDNESVENINSLKGCSIGCLVVILIGAVILLVALSLLEQAIDGFFEGVRDFFEHPLNPFSWF